MGDNPKDDKIEKMLEVKLALNIKAYKEELYWEQRARANWLKMKDKNTTFFHLFATYRKKRNNVRKFEDSNGRLVEGDDTLLTHATLYFKELFTSKSVSAYDSLLNSF